MGTTVADLWSGVAPPGEVSLGPVVVTSPLAASVGAFWVQDPGGGPGTGIAVEVVGFQLGIPPDVGSVVTLGAVWSPGIEGPVVRVDDDTDVEIASETAEVVVVPWTRDPLEAHSPVALGRVTVTSAVDPLGDADVDGNLRIRGVFGQFPSGWQEQAVASGIALSLVEVAPRFSADWLVQAPARAPEVVSLAEVGALAEGQPVVVAGVVQSAPWSADGRWTAVQDAVDGLWIDAEGWGLEAGEEGDVGTWEGEVRRGLDGLRLRTWTEPEISNTAPVVTGSEIREGQRVLLALSEIGVSDVWGVRPTSALAIDDRFGSLASIPDPCLATGVVRTGADGALQLAPFAWVE